MVKNLPHWSRKVCLRVHQERQLVYVFSCENYTYRNLHLEIWNPKNYWNLVGRTRPKAFSPTTWAQPILRNQWGKIYWTLFIRGGGLLCHATLVIVKSVCVLAIITLIWRKKYLLEFALVKTYPKFLFKIAVKRKRFTIG